ncbi:hypothetical protein RBS60_08965 [Sinomonas sp. ASV486]|uniref:Uncharacterized protein n=1 Tax=Sinomonas puerhi TaxID=3238584 RepID=A0AB39L894_9MICC|nr:hypothetical protein [Sinomonas sp. ASV486]MDQ4490330.1 hypothetical protein [Sinomonas sp. ASV486]
MGYFGSWLFENGLWARADEPPLDRSGPWLHLDIYDSDIATIRYAPNRAGTGIAFLGMTPRVYFDDESASAPTNLQAETEGLAAWVADYVDGDEAQLRTQARTYLADDSEPDTDEPDHGNGEDVFVEVKTASFLKAMGLGVPERYRE